MTREAMEMPEGYAFEEIRSGVGHWGLANDLRGVGECLSRLFPDEVEEQRENDEEAVVSKAAEMLMESSERVERRLRDVVGREMMLNNDDLEVVVDSVGRVMKSEDVGDVEGLGVG